jgi:hypothetical protein
MEEPWHIDVQMPSLVDLGPDDDMYVWMTVEAYEGPCVTVSHTELFPYKDLAHNQLAGTRKASFAGWKAVAGA